MRPSPRGSASAPPDRYAARDFFTYAINIQTLAPAGTRPGQFTIDANCDFLWQKGTIFGEDSGTLVATPNVTIIITDTSTGRNMMNVPVAATSLFGTGQLPFILPTPKLYQARATVTVTAVNNETGTTFSNLWFNFIGTQLFLK